MVEMPVPETFARRLHMCSDDISVLHETEQNDCKISLSPNFQDSILINTLGR